MSVDFLNQILDLISAPFAHYQLQFFNHKRERKVLQEETLYSYFILYCSNLLMWDRFLFRPFPVLFPAFTSFCHHAMHLFLLLPR